MIARPSIERPPRARASRRGVAVILVLAVAVALVGCGPSGPARTSPLAASPAPNGSSGAVGSPEPGDPGAPAPKPTHWPGTTVLAVIALGAADGEIWKAGTDLGKAADKQDLKAMWGAADGLATLIDKLTPNIARLEGYPLTDPVAAQYRRAFPVLLAGATQLRDAITARDAAGIEAGSRRLAEGLALYSSIRQPMAALVEQAITQQRLLVT
jgi:hypothetical protein